MKRLRLPGRVLVGAAVALSASIAAGAVGDLTYAKALPPGVPASVGGGVAAKKASDPAALGLTHPGAMVLPDDSPVKVAFDAADPKAERLDLVRIDRTGKGDFKNAATVKLTQTGATSATYFLATFQPQSVEITRDGQRLPVVISGRYYKSKTASSGYVYVQLAAEGECKFGDAVRKVCVADQNHNFTMGDVTTRKVGTREYKSADLCLIADEQGRFGADALAATAQIGQPVQVAGKWYTVSGGGMKVAAEPMPGPAGKLAVNAPKWQCMLTRDDYTMNVTGGAAPAELPAGDYQLRMFRLYREAGADGKSPCLYGSLAKPLKIAPGQTTTLSLGTNVTLTAEAAVAKEKDKVALSAKLTDAAGARILVYGADGKRPAAPQIEVVDKAGKVVYTATLAYG